MNIDLYDETLIRSYKSKSQIARVLTEGWFVHEMYCPNCLSFPVNKEKDNSKVVDFSCIKCKRMFQLKGQSKKLGSKVVDGAYVPMIQMIERNTCPDFFFMEYQSEEWIIRNLLLIPSFFINNSIIEKRKPLSINADRAGWIGCNILLSKLPGEGRISIVKNEKEIEREEVKRAYHKLIFLEAKKPTQRGWLADVLRCIQSLDKEVFDLSEIYAFEDELKESHPENWHIKDKIRQQLQVLRDQRILRFEGKGKYRLLR